MRKWECDAFSARCEEEGQKRCFPSASWAVEVKEYVSGSGGEIVEMHGDVPEIEKRISAAVV